MPTYEDALLVQKLANRGGTGDYATDAYYTGTTPDFPVDGTDESSSFDTLFTTTIPAAGGLLRVHPGTHAIKDDLTLAGDGTRGVYFAPGAVMSVDSGKTLTISAPIEADRYQIFTGAGDVVLSGPAAEAVFPEWFGAVADGVTNDEAAINAAITAVNAGGGGAVVFGPGTYLVNKASSSVITLQSGVHLRGAGRGTTVIKLDDAVEDLAPSARVLSAVNQSTLSIRSLTVDGNKAGNPTPAEQMYGIYFDQAFFWSVDDVEVRNANGDAIAVRSTAQITTPGTESTDGVISNCFLHGCDRGGLSFGSGWKRIDVTNCHVWDNDGGALHIEPSSGDNAVLNVSNCTFRCRTPETAVSVSSYLVDSVSISPTQKINLTNNYIEGEAQFVRSHGVSFVGNYVYVGPESTASGGITLSRDCDGVRIVGNQVVMDSVLAGIYAIAVGGEVPRDVVIEGNTIFQTRDAEGIKVLTASGVVVSDNVVMGPATGANRIIDASSFDAARWWTLHGSATVTANTAVAPDGTTSADTISGTGSAGSYISYGEGLIPGAQHTFKVYLSGSGTTQLIFFDDVTGVQTSTVTLSGTLTEYTYTATFGSGATTAWVGIGNYNAGTATSVTAWNARAFTEASGSAGIVFEANLTDVSSVSLSGNSIDGFLTGIVIARLSSYTVSGLRIVDNAIDMRNAVSPFATKGIDFATNADWVSNVAIHGNLVLPSIVAAGNAITRLSSALVLVAGGPGASPIYSGSGSPEGVVTASPGAKYRDRAATGTSAYWFKSTGSNTNTGWAIEGSQLPTGEVTWNASDVGIGSSNPGLGATVRALTIENSGTSYPAVQLHTKSDTISSTQDVSGLQWWMGATTPNKVAEIAAVSGGTAEDAAHLAFKTSNAGTLAERVRITSKGSVLLAAGGALAVGATDGDTYIPSCAGTPTGTPTSQSGMVPLRYDTTNNKLWVYNGAWKSVTLT